jgi:two-component system, OmpR family, phosphate regulon response regulator PhoB
MHDLATLLLSGLMSKEKAALMAGIATLMPDVDVRVIGSHPPTRPLNQPIRCYVDWLLPDISGLEMCRRLRETEATAQSHITIVLDEDDAEARRRAIRAGADDYLLGPLTGEILASRLCQKSKPRIKDNAPDRLSHGEMRFDLAAHQLRYGRKLILLRPSEFSLLVHFVQNPDRLFNRHQLIDVLGKDSEERTVDVWIGRLRRSLKAQGAPDPIRTVRSFGYVMDGTSDL